MNSSRFPSLGERGVALPLALMGLVAATIILTTALVTSSTEAALSNAHQRGVASLYLSDAAVDGFLTREINSGRPLSPASGTTYDDPAKHPFSISVARLARGPFEKWNAPPPPAAPDTFYGRRTSVYSISASPRDGRGRSVSKLVTLAQDSFFVKPKINAGAMFGSDADITGNSLVSGRQDTTLCKGAVMVNAVTHTDSSTVTYKDRNVDGAVVKDTSIKPSTLDKRVFNGMTIEQLAANGDIFFGPTYNAPDYSNSNRASSLRYSTSPSLDSLYNWGCPGQIDDVTNCKTQGGNTLYFPTVVIDAKGGTVGIQGDHGQGMLIVVNGNLSITGNFVYMGVIVVDGSLDVRGTGGTNTKIQGAVIATGDVQLSRTDGSDISGNAMIQYNSCAIENAMKGQLENLVDRASQNFPERTYGWFEHIR